MLERLIREEYQKYLEKIFYIDTFSEDFLKKIALERKGVEKSTLKILCENGKYNVKNEKGEILLKEWVDSITPFSSNGFYLVQKKKKYNILNRQGVLISKEWFSSVSEFHEGFAVVTRFAGRHNFISENGKFLLKKDVQAALDFCNGYATIVKYNDLFPAYNFVNSLGQVLFPEWHYDYFFSSDPELGFKDGFITIWEHGLAIKYEAYINLLGEKSWEKEDVYFLKNGYKILQKKDSLVLLDPQNNPLYETLKKEGAPLSSFFSFGWKPSDLHERQFQKKAFSYELREKDFLYSLKYEPVHLYEWYILCKKESCYYLYSKETYEYIFLAEDSTFTYGRNYFSYQERTFFVGKEIKDVSGIVVKYSLELKDPTCEFLEYDEFKKTLD